MAASDWGVVAVGIHGQSIRTSHHYSRGIGNATLELEQALLSEVWHGGKLAIAEYVVVDLAQPYSVAVVVVGREA